MKKVSRSRPSCTADVSEGRFDLLITRYTTRFSLVDRLQFIRRGVVDAIPECSLDFQGDFGKLPLPLPRPCEGPIKNRLYLLLGHDSIIPIAPGDAQPKECIPIP